MLPTGTSTQEIRYSQNSIRNTLHILYIYTLYSFWIVSYENDVLRQNNELHQNI